MTAAAGVPEWPAEGLTRVPYWVYCDPEIYDREQLEVFRGATWNFLCFEAELPRPNSYRRSNLGDMPVVVTRDREGKLHAFERHRGSDRPQFFASGVAVGSMAQSPVLHNLRRHPQVQSCFVRMPFSLRQQLAFPDPKCDCWV
jgi:hypothetical protein